MYRITLNTEIQSCKVYFIHIKAELEGKLFRFTFVFQKQILFFGNTSFLHLVGADIFICMYICQCVYICINVRDVFIASMLLEMCHFTALPEPRALLQPEALRLPPRPPHARPSCQPDLSRVW